MYVYIFFLLSSIALYMQPSYCRKTIRKVLKTRFYCIFPFGLRLPLNISLTHFKLHIQTFDLTLVQIEHERYTESGNKKHLDTFA